MLLDDDVSRRGSGLGDGPVAASPIPLTGRKRWYAKRTLNRPTGQGLTGEQSALVCTGLSLN